MAGFIGPYDPRHWVSFGIKEGEATVTSSEDDPAQCRFAYKVALQGGGVSRRIARFQVVAPVTGVITFDYRYEVYHAWYDVRAPFLVSADAEAGPQVLRAVKFHNLEYTGPRTFQGAVAIRVEQGRRFALAIGGSNFDSDSRLEGTLTVSNFAAPIEQGSTVIR